MQLQEAVDLVQAKFAAESQGQSDDALEDKYQDAFGDCPVLMEVATIILAQGLITQNYQQAMRQQQEEMAQQQAEGGEGGGGGNIGPGSAGSDDAPLSE